LEHPINSDSIHLGQNDVVAVLTKLAQKKKVGHLNWRVSIVDLLKLLDMDSSPQARRQLAQKLDVNVGQVGSPERNTALHAAVLRELAENGGQMPPNMRDQLAPSP
jgi:hypothetical protein